MKITTVVQGKRTKIGDRSKRVKDPSVFDFHYVPDEPLMRQEAEDVIEQMVQFEMTGLANHLAVIGGRGCGKTLTLKYLQREMPKQADLEVLYANCRHHNTTSKILAGVLNIRPRGRSLPELFEQFCRRCRGKTVVILDEIDLMSPKDKNREILYLLSRTEQPFMIIMLANNGYVLQEIDPATRSSLQAVSMHFKDYNADQIREILTSRAKAGLHHWDDGQLAEIAAMTTRLGNSDVRLAIKTLLHTVSETESDLSTCFELARRDVVIDMIRDLSDMALAILWAASTSRSLFARDVYQRYCRFCDERGEKPFSYFHFCSTLSHLQSVALVGLIATRKGRSYTNRVMLTFEPDLLKDVCAQRFGL